MSRAQFWDCFNEVIPEIAPPEKLPRAKQTKVEIEPIPLKIIERIPLLAKWPDPIALMALWNDHVDRWNAQKPDAQLPRVETLSISRREKARRSIAQFPDWRWWNYALGNIKASRFLTGRVPASSGHGRVFRADFDWLLAKHKDGTENVVKLHDGRYSS